MVTDENDNYPVFIHNKSLIIQVPENISIGHRLIQLIAKDPDEGESGQVVYMLADTDLTTDTINKFQHINVSEYQSQLFKIDPNTGWLTLKNSLDFEKSKQHLVRVLAKDKAGHFGFDEVMVNIFVTDLNDVSPQIIIDALPNYAKTKLLHHSFELGNSNYLNKVSGFLNTPIINLYINETPGLDLSSSMSSAKTEINNFKNNINSNLIAFVIVSDPDQGLGGRFECFLETMDYDFTKIGEFKNSPLLNNFNKNTMNNYYSQLNPSSNIGVFKLSPISNENFELSTIHGFDYELNKIEKVQVSLYKNIIISFKIKYF